jgi:hypothetical protein
MTRNFVAVGGFGNLIVFIVSNSRVCKGCSRVLLTLAVYQER